jgi:3-oxoacyl-[acyl-carrier protein] reductase
MNVVVRPNTDADTLQAVALPGFVVTTRLPHETSVISDRRCDDSTEPFFDLTDRVPIVTGAADGIGAAIAERFAAAGGIVIGSDIRDIACVDAEQLAARERCDESIEADVRALMHYAAQAFGRLHVLVNNARISWPGTVRDMNAPGLDAQLGVNFKEAVWITKHAVGIIEEKGPIINISSYAGSRGVLGLAGYGASKAVLESCTRVAALELDDRHIRVNRISPGSIQTGLNDNEHGRAEMRAAAVLQPLTYPCWPARRGGRTSPLPRQLGLQPHHGPGHRPRRWEAGGHIARRPARRRIGSQLEGAGFRWPVGSALPAHVLGALHEQQR